MHKITDGVWTVDVLVDDDGDLNIWVSADDLRVFDTEADIADSEDTWATRLVAEKPTSAST